MISLHWSIFCVNFTSSETCLVYYFRGTSRQEGVSRTALCASRFRSSPDVKSLDADVQKNQYQILIRIAAEHASAGDT